MTIAAQEEVSRGWFIDERKEDVLIDEFRKLLSIRMASPEQAAGQLSGGNQQKIVLARWLALRPKILIVDEPTRGIDIGSKVEVHNLLIDMAKQGIAVIVISSELPEILALSRPHRDDARGPRHRRNRAHRGDAGNPDGDDDRARERRCRSAA